MISSNELKMSSNIWRCFQIEDTVKLVIWLCDIWHLLMTICCESSTILKNVIAEYVVNTYLLIVLLYLNKLCKFLDVFYEIICIFKIRGNSISFTLRVYVELLSCQAIHYL